MLGACASYRDSGVCAFAGGAVPSASAGRRHGGQSGGSHGLCLRHQQAGGSRQDHGYGRCGDRYRVHARAGDRRRAGGRAVADGEFSAAGAGIGMPQRAGDAAGAVHAAREPQCASAPRAHARRETARAHAWQLLRDVAGAAVAGARHAAGDVLAVDAGIDLCDLGHGSFSRRSPHRGHGAVRAGDRRGRHAGRTDADSSRRALASTGWRSAESCFWLRESAAWRSAGACRWSSSD